MSLCQYWFKEVARTTSSAEMRRGTCTKVSSVQVTIRCGERIIRGLGMGAQSGKGRRAAYGMASGNAAASRRGKPGLHLGVAAPRRLGPSHALLWVAPAVLSDVLAHRQNRRNNRHPRQLQSHPRIFYSYRVRLGNNPIGRLETIERIPIRIMKHRCRPTLRR